MDKIIEILKTKFYNFFDENEAFLEKLSRGEIILFANEYGWILSDWSDKIV